MTETLDTERDHRRRAGVYYTPDAVADVLTQWALPGPGTVIDPSCGNGNFLRAACRRLASLGHPAPHLLTFGVDIDAHALGAATQVGPHRIREENLRRGDFLQMALADLGSKPFSAVVGNPPYVRHHWLDANSAEQARQRLSASGLALAARASLWAYFTLHAATFVADGGRLAFLLPGTVLNARYATDVLKHISSMFGDVWLVRVGQRLFDGTDEETVALLASNRGATARTVHITEVDDVTELSGSLTMKRPVRTRLTNTLGVKPTLLPAEITEALAIAQGSDLVHELGTMATIRIGTVTGANDFFVRSQAAVKRLGVESVSIVTRGAWLRQPTWSDSDRLEKEKAGAPARLLRFPAKPTRSAQQREIEQHGDLAERHHCGLRSPWYVLQAPEPSQLFLPYMGASAPRLVLNAAGSLCTNAVHRVEVRAEATAEALTVASWTSLFALSAELHGRHYGGGILKLEPSEAQRLLVALPTGIEELLPKLDELVRAGRRQEALELTDQVVLGDGLGLATERITALRTGIAQLSERRRPRRKRP